jgi:hypothetical protein
MYLEPWMILIIAIAFGACAYLNYTSGRKAGKTDGMILGIEGTFAYLETHNIIKFLKDGSIQGMSKKIKLTDKSVDILSKR